MKAPWLWSFALALMASALVLAEELPVPATHATMPTVCIDEESCGKGSVFAGAGIYLLQPRWNDNIAFSQIVNSINAAGVGTLTSSIQTQFDWSLQVAPMAWIGAVNDDGLGGRLRFFGFDHSTSVSHAVTGNSPAPFGPFFQGFPGVVEFAAPLNSTLSATPNGTGISVSSGLALNVWDFEAIQQFGMQRYNGLVAVGLRYAHMAQRYDATTITRAIPANNTPAIRESFLFAHNFNGAGVTVASENRYRLLGNFLAAYGNLRGSLLYGQAKQSSVLLTTNVPSFSNAAGFRSSEDFLPIVELELGLEASTQMGAFTPFLQVGLVSQTWFSAGNASMRSASIAAAAVPSDEDLGLIGLRITAGVGY